MQLELLTNSFMMGGWMGAFIYQNRKSLNNRFSRSIKCSLMGTIFHECINW